MAGPMGGVEPSQAILHTSRALLVINERGWGNLYISQSYGPALALKQPGYPGVYFEPCFWLKGGRGHSSPKGTAASGKTPQWTLPASG